MNGDERADARTATGGPQPAEFIIPHYRHTSATELHNHARIERSEMLKRGLRQPARRVFLLSKEYLLEAHTLQASWSNCKLKFNVQFVISLEAPAP
ncbi:MAG TPA: hypothetical protein VF658_21890 [Pyrinomonadaceae bacterium]|jgi:hypothetical protein